MEITSKERMHEGLSAERLTAAVDMLLDGGYILLVDVIPQTLIRTIETKYQRLLEAERVNTFTKSVQPSHSGDNHLQMQLPIIEPFSDPLLIANPIVIQIMEKILGRDLKCAYYNSHTSLPGSTHQQVHRDDLLLFGTQMSVATPPFMFTVNVPLCDFTEHNGSTEVWPSTHLIPDRSDDHATQASLARRSRTMASIRLNVPAGSIIIRDRRLWHRGMPNHTSGIRSMLSLVYKVAWIGWQHSSFENIPEETLKNWPVYVSKLFGLR